LTCPPSPSKHSVHSLSHTQKKNLYAAIDTQKNTHSIPDNCDRASNCEKIFSRTCLLLLLLLLPSRWANTKKIDFFQRKKKFFFMAFGSKCCLSMALKSSFVESIASLRTWRNFSSFFVVLSIFCCCCGREKRWKKLHRKEKNLLLMIFYGQLYVWMIAVVL